MNQYWPADTQILVEVEKIKRRKVRWKKEGKLLR